MTDAEIVRRVRAGDTEAYAGLVRRYRDAIYVLAQFNLGNRDDAQDVTQQAFLDAFQRLDQLRDPARFGAWLRRIAVSRCRMWRRHRGVISLETVQPVVCRQMQRVETRLVVEQALGCLSETSRLTLTLFYLRSLSLEEIAAFLEVPVTTVEDCIVGGAVKLWDSGTGEVVRTLTVPDGTVKSVAFSRDGQVLAAACTRFAGEKTSGGEVTRPTASYVQLWDAHSGTPLRVLAEAEDCVAQQVIFSPDSKVVAVYRLQSGENQAVLLNWLTGGVLHTFSQAGRHQASIAFSPDGKTLVSGAGDRIVLWKIG